MLVHSLTRARANTANTWRLDIRDATEDMVAGEQDASWIIATQHVTRRRRVGRFKFQLGCYSANVMNKYKLVFIVVTDTDIQVPCVKARAEVATYGKLMILRPRVHAARTAIRTPKPHTRHKRAMYARNGVRSGLPRAGMMDSLRCAGDRRV